MTDAEILDFCEKNDVEISFNFSKLTEGYRIRIRRGYFQYCTFVARDQIESSKAWGSAIKIILTNMVDTLNRAEHEQEERHAQDHADEESKLIEAIRDVLMAADAVRCDIESYEPELYASNALYHIPAGYCVQVDYNKLATAIHEAGYRKEKTHDPD